MTARWNVDIGPETSTWQGTKKAGALGLVSSQLTKRVRRSLLIPPTPRRGPADYQD